VVPWSTRRGVKRGTGCCQDTRGTPSQNPTRCGRGGSRGRRGGCPGCG
jgi:hypothetical protein